MPPSSVWDIDRNDLQACLDYYNSRGSITSGEARVMLQLQDEADDLLGVMRTWEIVQRPDRAASPEPAQADELDDQHFAELQALQDEFGVDDEGDG